MRAMFAAARVTHALLLTARRMENNSVSNGATWFPQSQPQEVHEINRPTVITGTRINSKAIYRKDAAVLLSPGASPLGKIVILSRCACCSSC